MRSIAVRFGQTLFVLWAVATLLFFMFRLMPGDPTLAYIDTTFTAEQQQALRQQFGLDRSLPEQYFLYFGNALRGEFGTSFRMKAPVFDIIFAVLPNTIALTALSITIAYIFGVLVGAWLAWKRGSYDRGHRDPSRADPPRGARVLARHGVARNIRIRAGWFPSGGANSAGAHFPSTFARLTSADFLHHLILPAATLALYLQGLPLLLMRWNMLDVLQEDFITMARMKGLPEWRSCCSMPPATRCCPSSRRSRSGSARRSAVTSSSRRCSVGPGWAACWCDAVAGADYPLAQGAFMFIALVLIVMNFIADLLYTVLDPRVAHG